MTTLLQIGEQLREARKQRGLYKNALAEKAGINRNTLHNLESGMGNVELNTLLAVCEELGLDIYFGPKQVSQKMGLRNSESSKPTTSFINQAIDARAKLIQGKSTGAAGAQITSDEPAAPESKDGNP